MALGRKKGHLMTTERKDTWAAGKLYEPYIGRWSRLAAKEIFWRGLTHRRSWIGLTSDAERVPLPSSSLSRRVRVSKF